MTRWVRVLVALAVLALPLVVAVISRADTETSP
jgi:hypothetical protein